MPERPHVVFLNRVYPPTPGATGALLAELAPALVERGWRVTVLTGPEDGEPRSETRADGVRVERVRALPFDHQHVWQRALTYALLFPAFAARAFRLPSPDVLVTKTDPPMLKVLGPILARLTGAQTLHWAQDLYPEVAAGVGVLSGDGIVTGALRRLSTAVLCGHDHVVSVGRCMRERLVAGRGLPEDHVSVVPNWPLSVVEPVPHRKNPFRSAHDLGGRFVVMYSGNMGLAHPFDTVLNAAAHLRDASPEVLFLFVGDGPRKPELKRQADRRGLSNVQFLPFQPRERLAQSLSAADLHLVTMRPELEGLVVPSKLYGALGAGRPVLFLGPDGSEAARVVRDHNCGTVLPEAAGTALADAVRRWHESPDRWAAGAEQAHAAVAGARADAVEQFATLLRRVLDANT
ncbi:glycosyltransferase involved in cell wall biosynthesis [Salinibacter ruber]|uniref:glycosyltransferase family 4 protein n=1 Tax=Salinibacter ruber TaxID=146919 RepID=UPI0021675D37|nr:glycosyltransferase family 4 protein [Salinibacter ruber]MCS3672383.1 glycosyltransferase involved in cell wall biosynthesis [Salinibacter ruber]